MFHPSNFYIRVRTFTTLSQTMYVIICLFQFRSFPFFVFLFHFVIWRSNFPFTLALKHQSNFDRVNSVVYSSLKASWNYGWVGGWAIPSGSLIFAIKYDSVWLTVAITEAASAHSHPSSLANVTHLKCEIK